jgi:hypothetical protein
MKKRKVFGGASSMLGEARSITPHAFGNRLVMKLGQPKILLSMQAYQDMTRMVSMFSSEVGWLGTVERKGNVFLIKEVFLFDQVVDGMANVISAKTLMAWVSNLMEEREDADKIINEMKFWGHSHVNMPTTPSGQDEYQMQVFEKRCNDFFLRGIANRFGRLEFTLYLYSEGVTVYDAEWYVDMPVMSPERIAFWENERKKVVENPAFFLKRDGDLANTDFFEDDGFWQFGRNRFDKMEHK